MKKDLRRDASSSSSPNPHKEAKGALLDEASSLPHSGRYKKVLCSHWLPMICGLGSLAGTIGTCLVYFLVDNDKVTDFFVALAPVAIITFLVSAYKYVKKTWDQCWFVRDKDEENPILDDTASRGDQGSPWWKCKRCCGSQSEEESDSDDESNNDDSDSTSSTDDATDLDELAHGNESTITSSEPDTVVDTKDLEGYQV